MPFFLFWGFLVWLGASLIFRFLGQIFFITDSLGWMAASYILVVPLILVLTLPIYKIKNITGSERLKAAIYIALPGMLIDSIVLVYFDNVFINLSADTDRYFASWLMWAYALIIITGLVKNQGK
ncbi:DUF5367 domain-containing protein [Bacillus anthracis]|uniref:DUF5367 domain-containing protein n=1 Tax=Bacillus cereus group TaxID=86661 RepID=UPI002DBCA9D1|nr:DUF5367 domain-containing protein [Bacillus anthracis]MEC0017837.1 DUF5367 domain-containing protein [Bacillus anthracis]